MPKPWTIRPLVADDVEAFMDLQKRLVQESGREGSNIFTPLEAWDETRAHRQRATLPEKLRTALEQSGWYRLFGLFVEDKLAGESSLRCGELPTERHRATLGISLDQTVRGQGLGRRLMEYTIDWAVNETSVDWIDLYVFEHNTPARGLYDGLGFTQIGRTSDRFRTFDKRITDLHMVLDCAQRRANSSD